MTSRKTIARYINLVYRVAAATDPSCRIRRDPLHRRYSVNYGVYISCSSRQALMRMKAAIEEALSRRGIGGLVEIAEYVNGQPDDLHVYPY